VREKSFYEQISAKYPQMLPFVASYLGVVNVSFKSLDDHDIYSNNTPVVMLEHNKHLLGDEEFDENHPNANGLLNFISITKIK
jgi:hypothetical protein